MKICDLNGFFRPLGGPQHPTTAAVMFVYDVTLPVGADMMDCIYNGMTNCSAGPEKLFWPPSIPKVIVASKMDLFDPEKHKVNLQRGLAFAVEKKIAHFFTSTLDTRSVHEAFKHLASEYAKLHIQKGHLRESEVKPVNPPDEATDKVEENKFGAELDSGWGGNNADQKSSSQSTTQADIADDGDGPEEEEHKPGLLEQPIVIEVKQQQKKVEWLSEKISEKKEHELKGKEIVIPAGQGITLGSIPYVQYMLNKIRADDLKLFHGYSLANKPLLKK